MFTQFAAILFALPLALGSVVGPAQDPGRKAENPRKARIEKFLNEHPEAKARLDAWKALTPEQKREKIQQKKAELKSLTPEERKARIEKLKAEHPGAGKHMRRHHRHGLKRKMLKAMILGGR